jgi:hypothetical protein
LGTVTTYAEPVIYSTPPAAFAALVYTRPELAFSSPRHATF